MLIPQRTMSVPKRMTAATHAVIKPADKEEKRMLRGLSPRRFALIAAIDPPMKKNIIDTIPSGLERK